MADRAPGQDNERPATAERLPSDGSDQPPPRPGRPEQSAEDTDSGWGERPEPGDDERLYRDRPPHWDSI